MINNTIVNNNNITVNNNNVINITINAFGSEDIEQILTPEYLQQRLTAEFNCVGTCFKIIRDVHFNPEHPQNQNIVKADRRKMVKVKVGGGEGDAGGGWEYRTADDVVQTLVSKYQRILNLRSNNDDIRQSLDIETIVRIQEDLMRIDKKLSPNTYYGLFGKVMALLINKP